MTGNPSRRGDLLTQATEEEDDRPRSELLFAGVDVGYLSSVVLVASPPCQMIHHPSSPSTALPLCLLIFLCSDATSCDQRMRPPCLILNLLAPAAGKRQGAPWRRRQRVGQRSLSLSAGSGSSAGAGGSSGWVACRLLLGPVAGLRRRGMSGGRAEGGLPAWGGSPDSLTKSVGTPRERSLDTGLAMAFHEKRREDGKKVVT